MRQIGARRRHPLLATSVVGALVALSGCGGDSADPLTFDTGVPTPETTLAAPTDTSATTTVSGAATPTTPTQPGPTATTAPTLGDWVDVTGNLAGLPTECGTVSAVAAHPDRPTVVASVALQGLWSIEGEGDQWSPMGTGGPVQVGNRGQEVIFDPAAPDTFWESGSYGPGVYRTTDGGQTFRELGRISQLDALDVDLSDPERQTLLAGTHEQTVVFRSTDGGDNWTDVSGGLPPDIGNASQPLVLDAQTFLLGTNADDGSGIFRTADGGETWETVYPGGVYGFPVVAAADGEIYWQKQQGGGLVRSEDAGVTWTEVIGPGVLTGSWTLVELPDGRLATIGDQTVVVSSDRGASWQSLGPVFPPGDPFGLTYSPAQDAIYIWTVGCEPTVPAGSIHRLDLTSAGP